MHNTFINFKRAIQEQMQRMFEYQLFKVDIDKDVIWDIYLNSFPEGTNGIYKERREYDCNCCKQFIRDAGGIVAVKNGKIISIWDGEVGYPYTSVAKALSGYVKARPIKNVFYHYVSVLGTDSNKQMLESGSVTTWDHFHAKLPRHLVKSKDSLGTVFSSLSSGKDVLKRSLEEISVSSIETVLELIEQNSIYRGDEHKRLVETFYVLKKEFVLLYPQNKDTFCWTCAVKNEAVARIRNSVIGTLLIDIESGKDLDVAVRLFETKVAPTNYKRPTAVITKRMIETAQGEIEKLELTESLQRRHAVEKDISVNDIIFANRTLVSTVAVDIFDEMKGDIKVDIKKLKKVEEVSIGKFVKDIVPKASSIKVLLENRHINNLVNIIAPVYVEAAPLFKWESGFSWSYNGDVADSIKERVKRAGGCVDAILRCSLSWFNTDDLDIHVIEPDGNHIFYSHKSSYKTTGTLDIDMNVNSPVVRDAVENIVWTNEAKMLDGEYKVYINNYTKREDIDVGFVVEIDYKGVVHTFSYSRIIKHEENVQVAKFSFCKQKGISFIESLPEESLSKRIWGIDTQRYHNVKLMLNSPNHWGEDAIGNKHWFFVLDNCRNQAFSRGFYNEFLREDLMKHRKVFEVLASKTKVPALGEQLCGVGFSSTKKDYFYCQVSGAFSRIIKVNII